MTNIGTHGLYCQTGENFASLALYMQQEAEAIDTLLQAQLDSLTGFLVRPTIIVTNSANVNIPIGGPVYTPWDTVVFNNSTFMSLQTTAISGTTETVISVGSLAGAPTTVPYLQGWYRFGFGTRMTATGAITAYSFRNTDVTVHDDAVSVGSIVSTAADVTFDTSTGGEAMNGTGTFPATGISGIRVATFLNHGNAASTVNLNTNSYLWVTYIGPDDQIEVA